MKKKLFLLAFSAIFSVAYCFAQDAESFAIEKQTLKEGKNLVHSTPTMKIYVTVKANKIIRMYGVDDTSKDEVEFETPSLAAKAAGDGTIDMPPMCFDCPRPPKQAKQAKKPKQPKCKRKKC